MSTTSTTPTYTTTQALGAANFIDSLGVNTHLTANSSQYSYSNVNNIINQLDYLGVKNVRTDGLGISDSANIAEYQQIAQATGIKYDMLIMNDPALYMQALDKLAPYIKTVEGPNEVNITTVHYKGLVGTAAAIALQKDLYADVHADTTLNNATKTTDVLNFTVSIGNSYAPYGNMTAYSDFTNVHAYGQYGVPPSWYLQNEIKGVTDTSGLPAIVTETGNSTTDPLPGTGGVSQLAEAKLLTDTYLDDFKNGVVETFIYQLEDGVVDPDPAGQTFEAHYGLFNFDGTPKLAAVAIHNLTTILADPNAPATFTPGSLSYGITNLPPAGNSLLLAKSDGSFDLAIWAEPRVYDYTTATDIVTPNTPVTVNLAQTAAVVKVYDTLLGSSPIAVYNNVNQVTLNVSDHAMVIEVDPSGTIADNGPSVGLNTQTLENDTGISATDGFTTDGKVSLTGTTTGTKVEIFDGAKDLGAAIVTNSTWSYSTDLGVGTHALKAVATDSSGNTNSTAAASTIVVETAAPVVAITSQVLGTDTGSSTTDRITSNGAVTLKGTLAGSADTSVQIMDGTNVLGTATLDRQGGWSFATTLTAGTHSLNAVATDLAGNSASTTAQPAILVEILPKLAITSQTLLDDTGSSATDQITSDGRVKLTGTVGAESGTVVQIFDGQTALGNAVIDSAGNWTFSTTLGTGYHSLHATATDAAGLIANTQLQPLIFVDSAPYIRATAQTLAEDTGVSAKDNVTTDGAVTFSGITTTETGVTVDIFDGTKDLGAATLTTKGGWSFATTLGIGTHNLTAVATDLAGITSTTAAEPTIVVQSAASAAPTVAITSQKLAQDTGSSTTDLITSNGVVTLAGIMTGSAGTTVQIMDGTKALGTATLNGTGGWTFSTTLAAGSHSLSATVGDLQGNTASTAAQPAILVQAAPKIAVISQQLWQDTGSSASDNITGNGIVKLSGTAAVEAGTTVQIFDGTTALGNVTVTSTGAWTFTTTLSAGSHTLHATATDLAGLITATQPLPTITVQTAPAIAATAQTLADDTGTSAVDHITTDGAVTFSGTMTTETGVTVEVFDGTKDIGAATLDGKGGWSFGTTLGVGTHNLKAVATDLAGLTSATAAEPTITVLAADPTMPTAPILPSVAITSQKLAQDTGSSATDNVTSNGAVTLTGTMTGAAGTTVQVLDGTTSLGTATLDGTGWTFSTTLSAGSHSLSATATDPTGHQATAAALPAITVQTPPAITATAQTLADDTGTSAVDHITTDGAVTFSGTMTTETGVTVEVFDGTKDLGAATLNGQGHWSFGTTLGVGTHNLKAVATDLAGITGTTATEPTITVLAAAQPTAPVLPSVAITSQKLAQDTGSSATDNVTSNGAVTLTGTMTGAAGTTVQVLDGTTSLGTATLDGQGGWTFSTTLANGLHTLSATATDPAGHQATAAAQPAITVDNSAPKISFLTQVLANDTGSSTTDRITSDGAVTVTGTADAGTTVQVYEYNPSLKTSTSLGLATVDANGNWNLATMISAGLYTLYATATDTAGNIGKTSMQTAILVDTSPMVYMSTQTLAADNTVTLGGIMTTETGVTVEVFDGANDLGAATLDGKGHFSYSGTLAAGTHNLSVVATDLAGLTSTSAKAALTVDGAIALAAPVEASTIIAGNRATNLLLSDGKTDTFVQNASDKTDTIMKVFNNATLNVLDTAAGHDQLWLVKSGNDLVIDTLGTKQQAIIKNWYSGSSHQLSAIVGSDGYRLDSSVQSLVQAMASFSAANAGFNPMTTTHTSLTDGSFGTVAAASASAWHQ